MKKYTLLLLSLFFISAEAQQWCGDDCCDENRFYAKLLGGGNFLQNTNLNSNRTTFKPGYIVAASLGYKWCYDLSIEGEYAYRRNEISKIHFYDGDDSRRGHYQSSSLMANLFWNFPACSFYDLKPYIGGGIGYDFHQMHASNSNIIFNQRWNHFSWQLMVGFAYPIFCNTDLSLEYKYHQGGSHFYSQSIALGLIYNFEFGGYKE